MISCRAAIAAVVLVAAASYALPVAATEISAPPSLVVKYDELDVATDAGATVLYTRLRAAARRVCVSLDGRELSRHENYRKCHDRALSAAVTQINREKLTLLHRRSANERAS